MMELPNYFEKLINSQLKNLSENQEDIKERLDKILEQTTITNGRVRELERWRAVSQGHWSGVNKTLMILWVITSFIFGGVFMYLWH